MMVISIKQAGTIEVLTDPVRALNIIRRNKSGHKFF